MTFDWKHPDYSAVYAERAARLAHIRANPDTLPALKAYYADHIAEFIADRGTTSGRIEGGRRILHEAAERS